MVDVKGKLVSLEHLKYYHDYNKATYSDVTTLIYNGNAIIDNGGSDISFEKMIDILSNPTCDIEIVYNSITLFRVAKSDTSVEFIGFHEASNKFYLDKLSVSSGNSIVYKENQLALSWDDLAGKPIATVAQANQYLSIQQ